MHRTYVTLIVLATVFCMVWYKVVIQRSPVVYHGLSYLPRVVLCIHTRFKARVQLFLQRLSHKSVRTTPIGIMGNDSLALLSSGKLEVHFV